MASTINASTSSGLVNTADTSGVLALQTANTTAVTISASQVVTLANPLPVASGGTGASASTGTGNLVLATSPTITTPTINQINTSVANTSLGAGNASIMKNRIINGAMVIDQRNAGASVTPTAATQVYTLDRWIAYQSQASKFSVQQNAGSVTPPVGFTNYLGVTSLSAYSVGSTEEYDLQQRIEAFNCSDLAWGTANAKTVTLSFQVYSSLTGTFSGAISNSAANRCYVFSYTVSSANTWTPISITITGDTTGTWLNSTNGIGIRINFSLGAGSTNLGTAGSWGATYYVGATGTTSVVGTNGATFYITGVQLEVGSSATGYEYRQYGTELSLCQRYYYRLNGNQASGGNPNDGGLWVLAAYNTTSYYGGFVYPVVPRTYPTWSYSNLSNMYLVGNGSSANPSNFTIQSGINRVEVLFNTASPWISAGNAAWLRMNQNEWVAYSAEL
jgi:hypothetical protein